MKIFLRFILVFNFIFSFYFFCINFSVAKENPKLILSDGGSVKLFKISRMTESESLRETIELRFVSEWTLEYLKHKNDLPNKSIKEFYLNRAIELCESYGLRLANVYTKHYPEIYLDSVIISIYYFMEKKDDSDVFLVQGIEIPRENKDCQEFERYMGISGISSDGTNYFIVIDEDGSFQFFISE